MGATHLSVETFASLLANVTDLDVLITMGTQHENTIPK
jgi:uncharacterized protein